LILRASFNIVGCMALLGMLAMPNCVEAADAERGRVLHEACLSCHGTSIYLPPQRKVDTYKKLGVEVERWNRGYNPKFTKAEIADMVAYLNETFYKFPVK
jgi:hypothetical protein